MMYSPHTWSKRPIIKLSHEKLRRLLSISDMKSRNVRQFLIVFLMKTEIIFYQKMLV